MIAPAGFLFLLTFAMPFVLVGRLSLFSTDYVTQQFVGLGNYLRAFRDPYFMKSFTNVIWFVLGIAPASILMGYWMASFLFFGFGNKAQSAGRFVCYVPSLTAGLVMTMLWGWLLARDGLINQFLGYAGLGAMAWLAEPWTARLSVVMVALSAGCGGYVIMFMAAMHSIPRELRDAAIIDGASDRQYRSKIVRPLLMPMVLLMLMLAIIGTMQTWEIIYGLTGDGGPKGATATPVYNVFQTAFVFGQSGYASAKGLILVVVIASILLVKQRLERWIGQGE
jgi:ABC-type sugar transport system permease subunit